MSSLSVNAPAFQPCAHTVTLFSPQDHRTAPVPCDLTRATLEELMLHATAQFGIPVQEVGLTYGGRSLGDSPQGAKLIDLGIGNHAVVLLHRLPPLEETLRQLMQSQAALEANQRAQAQLAAFAGIGGGAGAGAGTGFVGTGMGALSPGAPIGAGFGGNLGGGLGLAGLGLPRDLPAAPPPQMAAAAGVTPPGITRVVIQTGGSPSPVVPPTFGGAAPLGRAGSGRPVGSINLASSAGEFGAYAVTNEGSRALISAIEQLEEGSSVIESVLMELTDFATLAAHQHGSKVLRSLARKLAPHQAAQLLRLSPQECLELSSSTAGADVVVELLTKTRGEGADQFVQSLSQVMLQVCCSVNARKVLLCVLTHFSTDGLCPLYAALEDAMLSAATDQCGCITLQRALDHTKDPDIKRSIQTRALSAAAHLLTDPYGNYVLQHAVKDDPVCSEEVATSILGRLPEFACNKFASNVVERCIQVGPERTRDALIAEAIAPGVLEALVMDPYGNFVVQSCVENAPPETFDIVRERVVPLLANSPYGYRIEGKFQARSRKTRGALRPLNANQNATNVLTGNKTWANAANRAQTQTRQFAA
eukprot:Hpha_TRINITY_DN15532_c3_g8::TRINITY_DN15532_c3_g8_i1::g.109076::m.109076